MNFNIGGLNLKLPEIKLPELNLGKLDLSKGVEALKTVAKDMFAPSADGKTLFNKELNYKIGSFDIKLKNPVEVLSEKLLGKLSGKMKEFGFNPDALGRMLTGNREVTDVGEIAMPRLTDRAAEYVPEVGGGYVEEMGAGEDVEELGEIGGSTESVAVGSGTNFGDQVIEKFSGNISSMDEKINSLMNKGEDLSETEMLKLQQQMQKRAQLFQMMSQIMQMVHDTNKAIIQNMRA